MLASGFAGLGYQIVWTEQAALLLGHESPAVLAVVTAFFGGLALGGLLLGARIERGSRPRRWYVGAELAIALWSLLLPRAWSPLAGLARRVMGAEPSPLWQWAVAFGATFLLLLPSTLAMGATLPAMERLAGDSRRGQRSISILYASNTGGAVLGVLVTARWLIPAFGLARTAAVCAGCNLACAVLALWAFPAVVKPADPSRPLGPRATLSTGWRLAASGLLGIGYEIVIVRVLSQVTEDTVYTFALLLAVYLLGSAAGAAAYRRWLEPRRLAEGALAPLLSAACLLSSLALGSAEQLKAVTSQAMGTTYAGALASEAALALCAFGLPTLLMGAWFSQLSRDAKERGVSFGQGLGINMLAGAAAPIVFGVLLVPKWGPKAALLGIALGYLLLAERRAWAKPWVWVPAVLALVFGVFTEPLRFVDVPDGGHVTTYEEGVMATVSVVEDATGVARLRIDNRQQEGSSASLRADARQAWLPLLLHPTPHQALFLGLGTGVTATSAAADPTLHVDAVELLPEVVTASARFSDADARRRLHVTIADARRYVRAAERRYDVIVADNFHPARSGTGALYTVEHFAAVRERLAPGGIFCQWLPLHQLDLQTLRSIVRSFQSVYPQASAILANNSLETPVLGLVGRQGEPRIDAQALRRRLLHLPLAEQVAALGLEDELAVLGSILAGPGALQRFAGDAPRNTDDRPLVAYQAPRVTYAPDSTPAERLLALLQRLRVKPEEVLLSDDDPQLRARLAAYWQARDRFIESGRNVQPSPRVREMLAQVREPLLSVLRISPDFRPAYDPLLAMAAALSRSDASGARALLAELTRLQPARTDGAQLLARLGGDRASR